MNLLCEERMICKNKTKSIASVRDSLHRNISRASSTICMKHTSGASVVFSGTQHGVELLVTLPTIPVDPLSLGSPWSRSMEMHVCGEVAMCDAEPQRSESHHQYTMMLTQPQSELF